MCLIVWLGKHDKTSKLNDELLVSWPVFEHVETEKQHNLNQIRVVLASLERGLTDHQPTRLKDCLTTDQLGRTG